MSKVVAYEEVKRCETVEQAQQIADEMNNVLITVAFDCDGTPCVCRKIYA